MILIWIALGGAIGSVLRYLIYTRIDSMHMSAFPVGILVVNVLGSFLIGYLTWSLIYSIQLSDEYRSAILIGLLGGFTTFSSFAYNNVDYFMSGQYLTMLMNIVLSVVLCIIAAGAGLMLAKSIIN